MQVQKQKGYELAWHMGLQRSDVDEQGRVVTTLQHCKAIKMTDKFIEKLQSEGRLLIKEG